MRTWVHNPHAGGRPIPPAVRLRTEQRIRSHAEAQYAGKFQKLDDLAGQDVGEFGVSGYCFCGPGGGIRPE
jgi:hypothetical protein